MWRKLKVPTRREMHEDRDSSNSARKEAGCTTIVKEESNFSLQEKSGPQPLVMLGSSISPFGDIFPASFVPEC